MGVGARLLGDAGAGPGGNAENPFRRDGVGRLLGACAADQADDPQPVLGEGPGLVEAHGVDASECLQAAWCAYQDAELAQPPCRGHLRDGRHQGHALGHGGHCDRQSAPEGCAHRTAAQQGQAGHRGATGEGEGQHPAGQPVQSCLNPRRRGDPGGEGCRAAGFGLVARCHHHCPGVAGNHRGAFEHHATAVGNLRLWYGGHLFTGGQ